MKTRSMYKAERMSLDRFPEPVLETILCLLPTKEAARTSILSREWRYKWTKIPKLDLYHSMQCASLPSGTKRCKSCYDILQILLLRQGPIHELTLDIPDGKFLELDRILLHLSRNHPIKKLTLNGWKSFPPWYKLPVSFFSLHHLTDLSIRYIDLDHPPIFNGFGSLRSLYLRLTEISTKALLHLLSSCPSLKRLGLVSSPLNIVLMSWALYIYIYIYRLGVG
ncbi:putative F-box domain, leucine-rich repeat domain superfamily, F-box-like domain superfamily [Helianthus anomalus]